MVGDQHYPFNEGDQIEIMPKDGYNDDDGWIRRNDTKLQFSSPKVKVPLEVLFSLQESKDNWGCYSSLM